MRIRIIALLALICALFSSCKKPSEQYAFVYTPKHPADTFVFRFEMLMDEPQATYSTHFACRYKNNSVPEGEIPLLVAVTSPSGETFMENCSIPLASGSETISRKREGGLSDMEWPYRDRISPGNDTGVWHIAVRPQDRKLYDGILGMGFSYEEKR